MIKFETKITEKAFSNASNARRAAKQAELEPCEFTIKPDGGKFRVVLRNDAAPDAARDSAGAPEAFKPRWPVAVAADEILAKIDAEETKAVAHDLGAALAILAKHTPKVDSVADMITNGSITSPSMELKAKAVDIFTIERPSQKHFDAIKSAEGGALPILPKMEAPVYQNDKKKWLPKIEAALAAEDPKALRDLAAELKPTYTAKKMLRTHALLSVIALEAKKEHAAQ